MIFGFVLIAINVFVILRALHRRAAAAEQREHQLECDLAELERSDYRSK